MRKRDRNWHRYVIAALVVATNCSGSTVLWSVNLNFHEFAGQAGGFENDAGGPLVLQHSGIGTASSVRQYDVLRQVGTDSATGRAICALGQDGMPDFSMRRLVMNGNGSRWDEFAAEKHRGDFRMKSLVTSGTSRPGDFGVVAFEVTLAPSIGVTADQLRLDLASTNGTGELYEWTFVTLGTVEDAPFRMSDFGHYHRKIYHDLSGSVAFLADGSASGLAGSGNVLPTGRSMSQFLAGQPASAAPSGGLVRPGWWAIDDFNTRAIDGDEYFGMLGGDGRQEDNVSLFGTDLGLASGQEMLAFTIWMGVHDVGFDTDGDGFTQTSSSQSASWLSLTLGSGLGAIPEPSCALLCLTAASWMFRRKR